MTNKKKFLQLVSEIDTKTIVEIRKRIKNREVLRESQQIAIKVLLKLDELNWSQKDLAAEMKVSPQQISKIVSGKENLTIETQVKLQNVLKIPVLASYYESSMNTMEEVIVKLERRVEKILAQPKYVSDNYQESKTIKLEHVTITHEFYQSVG